MLYLADKATSPEPDIRQYAAFVLANLASNSDWHELLGKDGAINPISVLGMRDDSNVKCLGVSALRRLADHPANRARIVEQVCVCVCACACVRVCACVYGHFWRLYCVSLPCAGLSALHFGAL